MKPYRIKRWDDFYEVNRSRELKHMIWVPVPVKLDGDGYSQIMEQEDGAALYGAWIAIVCLAAKSHPRGTLAREDGTPRDHTSIARITKMPKAVIERALDFYFETLDWLEVSTDCANPAPPPHDGAGIPPLQDITGHDITGHLDGEGADAPARPDVNAALDHLNAERASDPPPVSDSEPPAPAKAPRAAGFKPPTDDELIDYAIAIGLNSAGNGDELAKFSDHFAACGWRVGNKPMKDWKAAMRQWLRRVPDFAPRPAVVIRGRR